MSKIIILIFSSFVIKYSDAAVYIQPPQDKPAEFADQEGCYMNELDMVLPYNTPYSPEDGLSCVQYICEDNGDTIIESCGVIEVGANCAVTEGNKFLPYPNCCDGADCYQEAVAAGDNSLPEEDYYFDEYYY